MLKNRKHAFRVGVWRNRFVGAWGMQHCWEHNLKKITRTFFTIPLYRIINLWRTRDCLISTSDLYPINYFVTYKLQEKIPLKFKCVSDGRCVAYTYQKSRRRCTLHSSTEKGKYIRGKQTGVKKSDYFLSLLEISFCSKKNRRRRCRREPKCHHVNCSRNAQKF